MKKLLISLLALIIAMPTSSAAVVVRPGDTLSGIAAAHGTTVKALADANGIKNPDLIIAGQEIDVDSALGASIPTVVAVYSDSLASRISSAATSFTLVRGTDKQSRSLGGFYGFVIDEGTVSEEFLTANCVATACTVVARGVDVVDGKTEVAALKFEHRRGATVKISNFPQLAVLSRILNGQESASSTFSFGDGTSGANKKLRADNGDASLPFVQYNEALGKWQISDDGVSTLTISDAVSGGLSASTTKGVFITDSQIGVNASSTGGLSFDSAGKLYFDGTVNAPTTFNGSVAFNGALTVTTPTVPASATPKSYVDDGLRGFSATGTAAGTVSAGDALFMTSTSTLARTNTSSASSTFQFVGIALGSASAGQTVSYSRPGGVNCGMTSLSPGFQYYLNGTAGQVATTPATTYLGRVGQAISSTCIQVSHPHFVVKGSQSITSNATYFQQVGFYPAKITVSAGNSNSGTYASSFSNELGGIAGSDGVSKSVQVGGSSWQLLKNGSPSMDGTVSSRTATGFVASSTAFSENYTIVWMAESD